MSTDPRIDAYIAKSAPFARPILKRLRALMHKADPRIVESLKWGVPHFEHNGIVAGMAAFKQHAAYGFWSKRLVQERLGKDAEKLFPKNAERGMGGRKIRFLSEMPPDALLLRAIRIAVALNEEGVRPKRVLRKQPPVKTRARQPSPACAADCSTNAHNNTSATRRLARVVRLWFARVMSNGSLASRIVFVLDRHELRSW